MITPCEELGQSCGATAVRARLLAVVATAVAGEGSVATEELVKADVLGVPDRVPVVFGRAAPEGEAAGPAPSKSEPAPSTIEPPPTLALAKEKPAGGAAPGGTPDRDSAGSPGDRKENPEPTLFDNDNPTAGAPGLSGRLPWSAAGENGKELFEEPNVLPPGRVLPEVGTKGTADFVEGRTVVEVEVEDGGGPPEAEDAEDAEDCSRTTPDVAASVKAELLDALVERAADVTLRNPRPDVEEEEVARINDAVELGPMSCAVSEA